MTKTNRCGEPQQEPAEMLWEELRRAEELFDVVTEDALIDACTYRIRTLLAYREYLLRTARRQAEQPAPIVL